MAPAGEQLQGWHSPAEPAASLVLVADLQPANLRIEQLCPLRLAQVVMHNTASLEGKPPTYIYRCSRTAPIAH